MPISVPMRRERQNADAPEKWLQMEICVRIFSLWREKKKKDIEQQRFIYAFSLNISRIKTFFWLQFNLQHGLVGSSRHKLPWAKRENLAEAVKTNIEFTRKSVQAHLKAMTSVKRKNYDYCTGNEPKNHFANMWRLHYSESFLKVSSGDNKCSRRWWRTITAAPKITANNGKSPVDPVKSWTKSKIHRISEKR